MAAGPNMISAVKIWVVLPAYNEQDALPPLIDSIIKHFTDAGAHFSLIVVNDGSVDKTGQVIRDYASRAPVIALHNEVNRGLAETLRKGLLAAVRLAAPDDVIITMDADNT